MTTPGDPLEQEAAELRAERVRVHQAERELAQRTVDLVMRLRRRRTVRAVASMVGISPARVSQIENGER